MKRFIIAGLVVVSFAAVFVMGVGYAVRDGSGVAMAADSSAELRALGTVDSVDIAKGVLVIKKNGSDDTLSIQAKADQLKDIKKGDKVKVQYTKGDKNVATHIRRMVVMIPTGC
jgi:hypothetical protein